MRNSGESLAMDPNAHTGFTGEITTNDNRNMHRQVFCCSMTGGPPSILTLSLPNASGS